MTVSIELYGLVCLALCVSLAVNVTVLIMYLGKKYPGLIYKEEK